MEAERTATTYVTTEGTRLEHGRLFARLMITARGKASDGMDLSTMESFEADDPAKLPKDAQILAAVEKAGANSAGLLKAQPADPFVGPAILSGRAAGVFFHEIFGHRIEGHRQKDESEGQTFTKSVGKPVLPEFLSVIFDPTRTDFQGTALNGSYSYDDEGVKAQPVTVVENGILKTFLMSRSPIDGFPHSNGHGRRSPGNEIVSRQSNLFVESSKKVSDAELRKMLIEEVKRQNKPYGLYFDQVTSGYTTTARRGLQAFTVVPLMVYRVYPDGRPDELIRGVDIVGTPLASFAKILATSDAWKCSTESAAPNRGTCRCPPSHRRFWSPKSRSSARSGPRTVRRISAGRRRRISDEAAHFFDLGRRDDAGRANRIRAKSRRRRDSARHAR